MKIIDQISFSPESASGEWSTIEVNPVRDTGDQSIEVCEEEKADFWSVYQRDKDGYAMCIADLPTKELADSFADLIKKVSQPKSKNMDLTKQYQTACGFEVLGLVKSNDFVYGWYRNEHGTLLPMIWDVDSLNSRDCVLEDVKRLRLVEIKPKASVYFDVDFYKNGSIMIGSYCLHGSLDNQIEGIFARKHIEIEVEEGEGLSEEI